MPLTLYIATTNAGKLRDFDEIARTCAGNFSFLSLPGVKSIPPPPEDAATFEENARAKAIAYSRHSPGLFVLADDSGLEVDALHGAPGVRSARYAADAGFDPHLGRSVSADDCNNLLLIENLRGIPSALRTARYRCVLAVARDGECLSIAHGAVEGIILESPRGSSGFGYDPLFYLSEIDRTMAEIDLGKKLQLSHRGHALRALLHTLRD
jgi:XTP/dITP diphosphohydrolase